jgi:hypothetical protein
MLNQNTVFEKHILAAMQGCTYNTVVRHVTMKIFINFIKGFDVRIVSAVMLMMLMW